LQVLPQRARSETRHRLYGGGRHYHLKRRYGIGAAEFDELVRDCNGGLGQFGDDTERLARAQLYLEWSDMTPEERTRSSDLARQRVESLRGSAA